MKLTENYYSILGLDTDANEQEIQNAYRSQIRILHPDVNKELDAENKFRLLHEAYQVLSNPEKKTEYDISIGLIDKKSLFKEFALASENIRNEIMLGSNENDNFEEFEDILKAENKQRNENKPLLNLFKKSGSQKTVKKDHWINGIKKKIPFKKLTKDEVFGERIFNFTIDAYESIKGTERSAVIRDERNQEKKITINIPPGIKNDSILIIQELTVTESNPKALIKIVSHQYLERDEDSLTLKIPFHEKEIREDEEYKIYTAQGQIKLSLPKESYKMLRAKNHGLENHETGVKGDFMVLPFTVFGNENEENDNIALKYKKLRKEIAELLKG
jgi:DnaJ-class molecular chaperone